MDELNLCRKDSSIIKEKHINIFGWFIVYGLATIQRNSKYPIACAPCYQCSISTYKPKITLKAIINAF